MRPEAFEPSPAAETTLVTGVEGWAGDIRYSAWSDADGDLVTTASIYSASEGAPDGELRTTITCQDGETSVVLGGLPATIAQGAGGPSQFTVSWSVDGGGAVSEQRAAWPVEGGVELITIAATSLDESLLGTGSALTLSLETNPPLQTTIDLGALSALPVYDNLLHCAGHDAEAGARSGHTELRIRAQLRDDERIEFAVQQRAEDGWSENILPRLRVMPAFGPATNWLSSTPVSVTVPIEPSHTVNAPDPAQRPTTEAIDPLLRSGWLTGAVQYAATLDPSAQLKLNSIVTLHGEQGLQLQAGCFAGVQRVQLAGAPADASGAFTLALDGAQTAVNWRVAAEGESSVLRPVDTERLLMRLRGADTLAVTLDGSASSFGLSGLFETPIEPNLDRCGNYTDPDWTPVTEAQAGTTDAGASYRLDYAEWNDGQRRAQVEINDSGEATDPDGRPVSLVTGCQQGRRWFHLGSLPTGEGEYTVRSRVDDGLWIDEQWQIRTADGGWIYANPVSDIDYERLRSGTTVEYEIPVSPVVRLTFDLAALFSTPVQANIDNCGLPLWPLTYVPLVDVDGDWGELRYEAYHWRDEVHSRVTNRVSVDDAPQGHLEFTNACYGDRRVTFGPLELTDAEFRNVTLQIDDVVRPAEPWRQRIWSLQDGTEAAAVSAPDVHRLIVQLRGASSLTVTIDGSGLRPVTFDLAGMFDTPIQENIDECGNYKPGETRELPPEFNTFGRTSVSDEISISYTRNQGPGTIPETQVQMSFWDAQTARLNVFVRCSAEGTLWFMFGDSIGQLSAEEIDVSWSLDGGPERRETWQVWSFANVSYVHPADAAAMVQAWRNGQELALTVHGTTPHSEQIDLAALFSTPVQPTLDECLALPARELSLPAGEIEFATEGGLIYRSEKVVGSRVAASLVALSDGENSQPPTRLLVTCGQDGVRIAISNVGRGQYLADLDETVEVTWRIGRGAPQTATWDIWPISGRYAISPQDDAAFFAAIKDGDSLSYSVATDPVATGEFDLAVNGFWETPVQPNLDACAGS